MRGLRLFCAVARKSIFRHLCIRIICASFRRIYKSLVSRHLSVYRGKKGFSYNHRNPLLGGAKEKRKLHNQRLASILWGRAEKHFSSSKVTIFLHFLRRIYKPLYQLHLSVHQRITQKVFGFLSYFAWHFQRCVPVLFASARGRHQLTRGITMCEIAIESEQLKHFPKPVPMIIGETALITVEVIVQQSEQYCHLNLIFQEYMLY